MDFRVKIVVLLLFVVDVFGRSIRLEDVTGNVTKINTLILPPEEGAVCELNGISHPLGLIFSAPDNPCVVCECNANWTGTISNSSCYKEECDEIDNTERHEGCIPVYDETKCCIIDFYCRDNIISNTAEDTEIEDDNGTEGNDEVVCPTPICADESCRIETPPGQFCPTCICEGYKEQNDFESPEQLSERNPLQAQNATEGIEIFLIPVPWSGISNGGVPSKEKAFEDESDYERGSERVEVTKPEAKEQENGERVPEEDSLNVIQGSTSKRAEPRRKRSANSQTVQQQWSVLQEEEHTDSDERERENSDSSKDYGEMKIFSQGESETADSVTNSEIDDLYLEESVEWEKMVPGCPTPICEHSGCRIGTPPGHQCPTCICDRRYRQP